MIIETQDFKHNVTARRSRYVSAFNRVLSSGWFVLGSEGESFEKSFAQYVGTKYCIGVGNGLEAIQITLMALGIGKGDEVVTTPLSAVATTLAILAVGAKPVFVDVDDCGLLDVKLVKNALTHKTRAVLPVHLYGQPLNLKPLLSFCKQHQLILIEDAAQAHGSVYQGKMVGSFGTAGTFSFYPTKNLGAFGDGGAIVTNDRKLALSMKQIRDYGQEKKYHHVRFGLNSRLDEVQAALLSVKLTFLDGDNKKRQRAAKWYNQELQTVSQLRLVTRNDFGIGNYHQFVVACEHRDALQTFLKSKGIQTMVHYPLTIPDQPLFSTMYKKANIKVARNLAQSILSLPLYPSLSRRQVGYVAQQLRAFFTT